MPIRQNTWATQAAKPATITPPPAAAEEALVAAASAPEPTPTPPPTVTEVVAKHQELPEHERAVLHARRIRNEICEKYAGKEGVNPFIWVKDNIDPLLRRYSRGDRDEELIKSLFALNSDVTPAVSVRIVERG